MGRQLGRDDYFEAAMDVLRDSGFSALSASALCERMGVTRGSFYHHFDCFDDLVAGLLLYWERLYTRELIVESAAVGDLSAMLKRQAQMAISLPHRAEVVFRAWGTINPTVAEAQQRVDRIRHEGLIRALIDHGVTTSVAETYASISLNALIGAQMRGASPEQMQQMYDELGRLLVARGAGKDQAHRASSDRGRRHRAG